MAGFIVTIECADSKDVSITLDPGCVSAFSFKKNTLNKDAANCQDNARYEIKITGKIGELKDITRELAMWALDANAKTIYRNVTVIVGKDGKKVEEDILRRYEFPNMFVIDYTEDFTGKSGQKNNVEIEIPEGQFTLELGQKADEEERKISAS